LHYWYGVVRWWNSAGCPFWCGLFPRMACLTWTTRSFPIFKPPRLAQSTHGRLFICSKHTGVAPQAKRLTLFIAVIPGWAIHAHIGWIFCSSVLTRNAELTPCTIRSRTTGLAFSTADRRCPTRWAIDARCISSFLAVISVVATEFTSSSTKNIIEFPRAAWNTRSLACITLTETNGAPNTRGCICHFTGTVLTRRTYFTRTIYASAGFARFAFSAFGTAFFRLFTVTAGIALGRICFFTFRIFRALFTRRFTGHILKFTGYAGETRTLTRFFGVVPSRTISTKRSYYITALTVLPLSALLAPIAIRTGTTRLAFWTSCLGRPSCWTRQTRIWTHC